MGQLCSVSEEVFFAVPEPLREPLLPHSQTKSDFLLPICGPADRYVTPSMKSANADEPASPTDTGAGDKLREGMQKYQSRIAESDLPEVRKSRLLPVASERPLFVPF